MLRTVWSKTLRDYRFAILGWGIGLGLFILITMVYYGATDEPARAAQAQYAGSFRFFGDPVAVGTLVGYTTWHTIGVLPLALSIWTVLAGARMARGEEEHGSLDLALVTRYSRVRLLAEKIAALVIALGLIAVLLAVCAIGGELGAGITVDIWGALLMGVNVALAALVFGMTALMLSQFFVRRSVAAGWAGALVIVAYLMTGTARMVEHGEWLGRLSPLYYHDLSKPLISTVGVNVGAMLTLVALSVVLGAASVALFARRDIGGVSFSISPPRLRRRKAPSALSVGLERARRDIFGRSVGLGALRAEMGIVAWWLLVMNVFTVWLTLLARTTKDAVYEILQGTPGLIQILGEFDIRSDNGFIAAMVFLYLPVMTALFAMMLALAWPHDLDSGRVELGLCAPLPRWRIYLERFGAVGVALLLAPLANGLAMMITARVANLTLDVGNVPAALLGLFALEVISAAAVYTVAGWLRSGVIAGVLGALIGVSFFAELLNPILKLPSWVITFSIFHHFGSPLTRAPYWGDWLVMIAIAAMFLLAGAIRFSRGDVRSGA